MRLLLAGDAHGNVRFLRRCMELAQRFHCRAIFQLGDFGWWPHHWAPHGSEKNFVESLEHSFDDLWPQGRIYWLDGNHENHPALWSITDRDDEDFVVCSPRIRYSPRGHRWSWDDVRFVSCGGAHSIDKAWRLQSELQPLQLWWPTELITDADVAACLAADHCDVLLSHDAPFGVTIPGIADTVVETALNRHLLRQIVNGLRPSYVYHGHYHLSYESTLTLPVKDAADEVIGWHDVDVVGLAHEFNGHSWAVFDTATVHLRRKELP